MEVENYSYNGSSDEESQMRQREPGPDTRPLAPSATPSAPSATPSAPSASPSASASDIPALSAPSGLPDSVRGAPEALKPAIRKKQNKESARRSRRRRKELVASLSRSLQLLLQKTHNVERRLLAVEVFVAEMGFRRPGPLPQVSVPMAIVGAEPGSRAGTESEAGSGNGGSRGGDAGDRIRNGSGGSEEDEVQRLIEKCIGQL